MRQRKQSLHPEEGLRGPPGQVLPTAGPLSATSWGSQAPRSVQEPALLSSGSPPGQEVSPARPQGGSVSLFTPGESQVMWRTPAHLEDPAQSHWWSQHLVCGDPITLSHTGSHLPATWLQARGRVSGVGGGWGQAHYQSPWGLCQCPGAAVTNDHEVRGQKSGSRCWWDHVPSQDATGGVLPPPQYLN